LGIRVSFVIPTLNQAPFIRRCLDSCLEQQLPEAEILVRDGGSTDGTQAILAEYRAAIAWSSEPDRGQADAVNKAVAVARGDVIAWINSDDYYAAPGVLRAVVDVFEQQENVDIVYGDGLLVAPDGQPRRKYPVQHLEPLKRLLLYPVSPLLQPAVFFRKDLFQQVGGLCVDNHLTLDYELWLRMFPAARKSVYLRQVLACAVVHQDAKSIKYAGRQLHELRAVKAKYAGQFELTAVDRLRLRAGQWKNRLYLALVRLGLLRP
jgi:glycosyltransferase involved in cell wall biosynthesis